MNGFDANALAMRSLRAGLVAACVCGTMMAAVFAPGKAVDAQNRPATGRVIPGGRKPFRETMSQMRRRDAAILRNSRARRLPKRHRSHPYLPQLKAVGAQPDLDVSPRAFSAPGSGGSRLGIQAPQVVGPGFAGTSLTDESVEFGSAVIPPDTMGAAGPEHFVEMTNGSVAVFDKSSGTRVSLVALDTFFTIGATPPPGGAFNPRVLYDRASGRWFACVLDKNNLANNNHLILAVSATDDPTGVWDKYSFLAGDANDWADYATLGVDANGVYFGWRLLFGDTGAVIAATPKSSLIAASPSLGAVTPFGPFNDMFSTPQPAVNLDGSANGLAFFVSSHPTDFAGVVYRSLSWSGSTPSLSGLGAVVSPSYFPPNNFLPNDSTTELEVGDDRLTMAMIRGNKLWTCRTVYVDATGGASGPDRNALEWVVLDVSTASATLSQNGRVFDPNVGPRHYFYPSIAPTGQGHAAMGFSGAKTTEFIGAYTCGRLAGDAANTMQSVGLVKAGVAAYTILDNANRNRWGDYSYTTVDPNDDMTLWTVQEYAEATGPSIGGSTSRWGTRIAKLMAPAPTLDNPGASGFRGQNDKVINLAGTGIFDPGAAFPNRLDISISGDGISGKSVTYTGPSAASVTFDIAANATTGARDITLTNPDGQSVTVVGGLTIDASFIPAPTNLSATAANSTRINLAWTDESTGESGFKIERKLGAGAYSQIATVGANVTTYANINLTPNSTYTYKVRAYAPGAHSAYSNEDDATTPALPAAPSSLSATAATSTKIVLNWSDNSNNEVGFRIERKTGAGSFANLTSAGANKTSYNDIGVSPVTTYTYRVRSYNGNGQSAYSNEDDATTPALPLAPTNLVATAVSSSKINLAWSDNSNDENGFKVERKSGAGSFASLPSAGANATTYSDIRNLAPDTAYTYRIRAYNLNGDSPYSNEDDASTPPVPVAPSGLTATAVSSTRIDLAWSDNSANELGFRIERKIGAGSFTNLTTAGANKTSYINSSGVTPGTTYTYRVRSYNANGHSAYSNEDDATTPPLPAAPTALNATAVSSSQINLTWVDNASDEQGFKIERRTTGAFAQIAVRPANSTSFSNTGLAASTTYRYRVRAYNANGNSAFSNEDFDTTPAGPSRRLSSEGSRATARGAFAEKENPPAIIRRKFGAVALI